jgi:ATP-dependent DNA helicase DinG
LAIHAGNAAPTGLRTVTAALAANGALARVIPGFSARPEQQAMADTVAQALSERRILICEAGTGTGKTFAYLVPAILSGLKVIVSTGTRNLQDQIFLRDLPIVRDALTVPVSIALLKGRANYLCLQRLDLHRHDTRKRTREVAAEIAVVKQWAGRTRTGDIAEIDALAEDSAVWPLVTSTAENCLGQACGHWHQCHVVKARRDAIAAEIVVVNHHLFLADMALREEGMGEVLPTADAVIIDEAHQLPDAAQQFFGTSLSSRQLNELARDTIVAQLAEAGDMAGLRDLADGLSRATRDLRLALGTGERRAAWQLDDSALTDAAAVLDAALEALSAGLALAAGRGKTLEHCSVRAAQLRYTLAAFTATATPSQVRWFEAHLKGFILNASPLDVADAFAARMKTYKAAWIFTSATLSANDDFRHFEARMGIAPDRTARWDSPYDYARQTLLYLPESAPDPHAREYTARMIEAVVPVLLASRGRAFILFTSHRALREARELLQGRLPYPVLMQGEAPRQALIQRFRSAGNAILLGASSFWEGVDVKGDKLSCVIIDKLPFSPPDDPLMQARITRIRERGGNPFIDYQLPEAIISLKQGAGRLIRSETDRGVLVLCDPRLFSKRYGKQFLAALPAMPQTHDIRAVEAFFQAEQNAVAN